MDVKTVIAGLEQLDRAEFARVEAALRRRQREFGAVTSAGDGGQPVSDVVEYRPHADGTLQAEVRYYVRKDGSAKEQGSYWYFRYHEGGKQKTRPLKASRRRRYARRRTLRDGEPCVPRWRSGERAAAHSYVSGGTRAPTSTSWKTSYSRKLCHPRKKIPETDAIFEQVNQMNAQADDAADVLRISMDAAGRR